MNVTATRLNDTAMNVSWIPLTLVEARGFVKYVITYTKAGGSRKRQSPSPKIVNGTDTSCVVNDLEPGVEYDVIVGVQTGGGTNGKHCEEELMFVMTLSLNNDCSFTCDTCQPRRR